MKTFQIFTALILTLGAGLGVYAWRNHSSSAAVTHAHKLQYQCPMHPQIVKDEPGDCPICHMHLQLIEQGGESPAAEKAPAERRILKYRHPMNPKVFSDHAQKDEMGMDYVPVYSDEMGGVDKGQTVPGHAGFTLSTERRQLIGVRSEEAKVRMVLRTLRLPGRVGEDPGSIMAQALEMDGSVLKSGLDAQVWVTGEGARKARVVSVDRSLDSFSRTFGVRLALLESPGAGFRPGVYCDARVQLRMGEGVTVPKEAVLDTGDHQVVFVEKEGGRFEPRSVEVGKEGDEYIEIRKGVSAGEKVVNSANFLIDSESRFQAAARDFGGAGHD